MAIGDFHLHSTASDGVHTPTWVMETAAARGVRVLSLTDHDSTEGWAEAKSAADRLGLRLIPGIELSTDMGPIDTHLLAFGFDIEDRPLQDFLKSQRDGRIGRTHRIVEILRENGMPLDVKRVFEIAGEATVGRPHVARALVEAGHVASVQEAFDLWLGNGKAADVDRPKLSPQDAIAKIHEAGGVVFCAHAVFMGDEYPALVEQLTAWGLDGLETYYKHYDAETVETMRQLGTRLGLALSGGSDYHGLGNPDDREIGDIPFPDAAVEAFVGYLEGRGVDTGT
ncbi:MAG: PHP domain-containing protein [Dehalococcoidia bacterium]|nr:PHP domain-containing protein [Dehalococcoidia bacterium]